MACQRIQRFKAAQMIAATTPIHASILQLMLRAFDSDALLRLKNPDKISVPDGFKICYPLPELIPATMKSIRSVLFVIAAALLAASSVAAKTLSIVEFTKATGKQTTILNDFTLPPVGHSVFLKDSEERSFPQLQKITSHGGVSVADYKVVQYWFGTSFSVTSMPDGLISVTIERRTLLGTDTAPDGKLVAPKVSTLKTTVDVHAGDVVDDQQSGFGKLLFNVTD